MQAWKSTTIEECLAPLSFAGKTKIQSRAYKASGRFPVIDQGREYISGWTDDESAVIDTPLPLIVFGDHTRVFKFTNMSFARGADGTQLLRPKSNIDPLFFFYVCRSIDLPARGYNRHFTVLKEKEFSYPTCINEQKSISAVLYQVELVLRHQSGIIRTLKNLKHATMHHLFTCGLRGEAQKETAIGMVPESWKIVSLDSICQSTEKVNLAEEAERSIHYIDVSCVSREFLCIESTRKYLLKEAPGRARKCVKTGDVILATIRPTLHRIAHISHKLNNQVCSTAFCVLRARSEKVIDKYIYHAVQRKEFIDLLARIETGASYPAVTDEQVKAQCIPLSSSLAEQQDIVTILDAIDQKIALHQQKHAVLQDLFQSLLHQLMTGKLRVNDLDLSALPTT